MASLSNPSSGTGVLLHMFDPDAGASGQWLVIGGQRSNDLTINTALIDASNKDSDSFQEFLEDNGTQDINSTVTLVFSSNATFAALQLASRTKAVRRFMWTRGSLLAIPGADVFNGMIGTMSDDAVSESLVTSTFSILSANDEGQFFNILFNDAVDVNTDDAIDADGNAALARA